MPLHVRCHRLSSINLMPQPRIQSSSRIQAKFLNPFTSPPHLASIAEDGTLKLWTEDLSVAALSGRRFRRALPAINTKSRLPFVSLDVKLHNAETYLALITRDGNLSVLEPRDHDRPSGEWFDWTENRDFYVVSPPPSRSVEASFRVYWHAEKMPCWSAVGAGLSRTSMGLVVAAMDAVKVFRTDAEKRLYLACEVKTPSLVRDVAWANGSMRGWDIIAGVGKDGAARIWEVRTEAVLNEEKTDEAGGGMVVAKSGIGVGLSGGNGVEDKGAGRLRQVAALAAEVKGRAGLWRCSFSSDGTVLTTSGDDGVIRTYKRGIDMKWRQFAELDAAGFE